MSTLPETEQDPEEQSELVQGSLNFPVVGIGTSAGGLNALLRFFENMPATSGMAFVVIIHLSPDHESNAAAILQRVTAMKVQQVLQPTPIEANQVYVIPPSHSLSMNDGYLRLTGAPKNAGAHVSIDLFFRSLGQVHQERAVAIVMSGTGSDGSVGLARVKERGGITLVQSPDDAEYDGMPKSAIATGTVDFVLNVVEMPQRLLDLWANASRISLPKNTDPSMKVNPPPNPEAAKLAEEALRDIMALLRSHSRNDFRHYKRATVLRRIERRLQVNSISSLPDYRDFLRENPAEAKPLLQDMLISVTNFFRDRDAFEALERDVLPGLVEKRMPGDPIRVWAAGCATGEEAYSLAMLLREQAERKPSPPDIQVFATDIDERAIGIARAALYPESIITDVSPGRLRQFFVPEQGQLRVVKYVREKVLFAPHNVLRDPPFSRLDLICCRNMLIYLDREAQTSVLEMFRFALKPNGYLFLGTSESADAVGNLFTTVDKKNRIFRSNPNAHAARHLPLISGPAPEQTGGSRAAESRREFIPPSFAEVHRRCIEQAMAPSVLIDEKHSVLHLSEHAGKFLTHGSGTPSLNLLANLQSDLRTELRTALFQANEAGKVIETRPVDMQRAGGSICVKMTVRSFQESAEQPHLTLVTFEEVVKAQGNLGSSDRGQVNPLLIDQMEKEIRQLKEHLQETIEQTETSTEELKASNEELQAINEELRSATEELETSKEELQSMNEELSTVNFELKSKVDETSKINDDLLNLVASSDIATIFIDKGMRIKRYTPRAVDIFSLIPSDLDRSLLDITHRMDYEMLAADVKEVFSNLTVVERRISADQDRHFLVRIRPYRTIDDRIDGAVLTFVDVTALRQAQDEARAGAERLRFVAETTRDYAILTTDEEGLITTWNLGAERMFGYSEQEATGQPFGMIFTPQDRELSAPEYELRQATLHGRGEDERWHQRKDGSVLFCSGVTTPLQAPYKGFAKIARDLTEHARQSETRDELLAREQAANESKDQFLAVMSHELKHPLNLIQVNTELLISQPNLKTLPPVVRAGEAIQRAVAHQAKIIDDLLDLSRVRTGKLALNLEAVNLNEMVVSVAAAAYDAGEQKGLIVEVECKAAGTVAFCDRVRTEQIFWNLANNAIKFTPAGKKIKLELDQEDGYACFTVSDTGQGIAPEFLPGVFEMFSQVPTANTPLTKAYDGGLGVGLALVQQLTAAQGGRVEAESKGVNHGSTFRVWLPLNNAPPQAAVTVAASRADLKGLKILAVDDMFEILDPFAELLRMEGATVDLATSGAEALQKLASGGYDLLISDLGMDGMDGYELIRRVRQQPHLERLQAIALSGYGRQVDVDRALQSGFDRHVSKPASVEDILRVVAELSYLH